MKSYAFTYWINPTELTVTGNYSLDVTYVVTQGGLTITNISMLPALLLTIKDHEAIHKNIVQAAKENFKSLAKAAA